MPSLCSNVDSVKTRIMNFTCSGALDTKNSEKDWISAEIQTYVITYKISTS